MAGSYEEAIEVLRNFSSKDIGGYMSLNDACAACIGALRVAIKLAEKVSLNEPGITGVLEVEAGPEPVAIPAPSSENPAD